MRIDILTLFPAMCEAVAGESIIGRARKSGAVEIYCHNIRDYSTDKHGRVDDAPYGGGKGMVMAAQPIFDCVRAVTNGRRTRLVYLSPKGERFTQGKAEELSREESLTLLCGHYEGVDQRVLDKLRPEEISIGDYVLTGGELPALVVTDAVCRMLPGVLSDPECYSEESFYSGLLEYPHYTRPEVWEGVAVPAVLLGGNHAEVERWRLERAREITLERRPDLLGAEKITPRRRPDLSDAGESSPVGVSCEEGTAPTAGPGKTGNASAAGSGKVDNVPAAGSGKAETAG